MITNRICAKHLCSLLQNSLSCQEAQFFFLYSHKLVCLLFPFSCSKRPKTQNQGLSIRKGYFWWPFLVFFFLQFLLTIHLHDGAVQLLRPSNENNHCFDQKVSIPISQSKKPIFFTWLKKKKKLKDGSIYLLKYLDKWLILNLWTNNQFLSRNYQWTMSK